MPGRGARLSGNELYGFAVLNDDRATGLFGDFSGRQAECLSPEFTIYANFHYLSSC